MPVEDSAQRRSLPPHRVCSATSLSDRGQVSRTRRCLIEDFSLSDPRLLRGEAGECDLCLNTVLRQMPATYFHAMVFGERADQACFFRACPPSLPPHPSSLRTHLPPHTHCLPTFLPYPPPTYLPPHMPTFTTNYLPSPIPTFHPYPPSFPPT